MRTDSRSVEGEFNFCDVSDQVFGTQECIGRLNLKNKNSFNHASFFLLSHSDSFSNYSRIEIVQELLHTSAFDALSEYFFTYL